VARRCEAGLEPAPKSARLLTDTFFNVGESRYDAVVTYEHLAFKVLDQIEEYASTMAGVEVFYPRPTLMNQHPVVTLNAAELTDVQKLSARKWLDYLRSADIQKNAVDHGFRPVNPDVQIREYGSETNPFLRHRHFGVEFNVPIIEPPRLEGDAVFDIVRMWEDATGRN
jgi:ABC-type sulfate transport system substrate-binding protein